MSFVTSDHVVGIVYGLLSSITKPKYLTTKPTLPIVPEYVVVNALPIDSNVLQRCIVNVNYHVKDIASGVPDLTKIEAGSNVVINLLQKVSTTGYLIDYEGQETIREDSLGEHYSNLRFSVKFINN